MALPADVLAAVTKLNRQLAPMQKALAQTAEHSKAIVQAQKAGAMVSEAQRKGQLDAAAKVVEQIGPDKARQMAKQLRIYAAVTEARNAEAQTHVVRRSECPGARTRASRGRPVRRRGSRRTAAPTRAGPEPGDPEPAGSGAPVGSTSRAVAFAGRPA